jgi:hypothetical protein
MGLDDTPHFKPFTIALIQYGIILDNKQANLSKARDMIFRAAVKKPDLIVLPVRLVHTAQPQTPIVFCVKNYSIVPMVNWAIMPRSLAIHQRNPTTP